MGLVGELSSAATRTILRFYGWGVLQIFHAGVEERSPDGAVAVFGSRDAWWCRPRPPGAAGHCLSSQESDPADRLPVMALGAGDAYAVATRECLMVVGAGSVHVTMTRQTRSPEERERIRAGLAARDAEIAEAWVAGESVERIARRYRLRLYEGGGVAVVLWARAPQCRFVDHLRDWARGCRHALGGPGVH